MLPVPLNKTSNVLTVYWSPERRMWTESVGICGSSSDPGSAVIPHLAHAAGHGRLDPLAGCAPLVRVTGRPPALPGLAPWPPSGGGQGPAPQPGQGRALLRAGHAVAHCPGTQNSLTRIFPVPNMYVCKSVTNSLCSLLH